MTATNFSPSGANTF